MANSIFVLKIFEYFQTRFYIVSTRAISKPNPLIIRRRSVCFDEHKLRYLACRWQERQWRWSSFFWKLTSILDVQIVWQRLAFGWLAWLPSNYQRGPSPFCGRYWSSRSQWRGYWSKTLVPPERIVTVTVSSVNCQCPYCNWIGFPFAGGELRLSVIARPLCQGWLNVPIFYQPLISYFIFKGQIEKLI